MICAGGRGVCPEDGSVLSSVSAISTTMVSETERDLLMADRSRLLGEIHSMVVKVQRLKALHEHSRTECVKLDHQRQDKMSNITTRKRKVVLLGLYLRQISNLLTSLQSKTKQLKDLFQREVNKTKHSTLISCEKRILTDDLKKVEELIDEISRMFSSLLAGEAVHSRSVTRSRVSESLGTMSAASITRSLIQFTEALGKKVQKLRLEKDDISGGEFYAGSGPWESVKDSIDEMNKRLVTCHAAAQNHLASVNTWRENVAVMMKKAGLEEEAILATQLSAQKASLASSVADLRMSMAGQSVNSSVLQDLVALQQNQIDDLCGTLSSLIPNCSSASLRMSQLKSLQTMSGSLPRLAAELTELSHGLEDLPASQLTVLGSAPMWKLSSTNLTGDSWVTMTPTSHLSILRKRGKFPADPSQACFDRENSLSDLTKLLVDISRKEEILAEGNSTMKAEGESLLSFERLSRTLQTNMKEQSRNLLPVIEECGKQQEDLVERLGKFEKLHQDWRRQPAADVAAEEMFHWGEVEGKSLKQLQDLAKCYINKLEL